jgi:hypothetical protein
MTMASSSSWFPVKLPSGHVAVVDVAKITGYLLNPSHPDNGGKARFFGDAGFSSAAPEALVEAIGQIAASADVVSRTESPHGVKFVVDGILRHPHGRFATVRTIWIIERGRDAPRFVTAYPVGRGRG